jgi:hypothetical protein
MARFTVASLALALWLCTGCFVFDEIDSGREMMNKHSGRGTKGASGSTRTPEAEPDEEGPGLLARVQQFFAERREPSAPRRDPNDAIVSCELEDGVTFTYASDCLSRGGSVL